MNTAEISFIIILAVMAAFYLMFIRPARNEQKRLEQTIRDLHAGDEIITTAGFFARIIEIYTPEDGPAELVLELGTGLQIRALTSSVLRRIEPVHAAEQPQEAKET